MLEIWAKLDFNQIFKKSLNINLKLINWNVLISRELIFKIETQTWIECDLSLLNQIFDLTLKTISRQIILTFIT